MKDTTNTITILGRCLVSETRKSRKTFALWLTLLYPLFVVTLVALSHFGTKFEDTNPWTRYVYNIGETGSFFLPFFIIAVVGFYGNIEHKSNTWKHILSLPVPKWAVFTGKLGMIILLILCSVAFFIIFTYAYALILNQISARMTFANGTINFILLIKLLGRSFLSGLFIISLQYWMSLRMKNIIVPFIIGLSMIILPIAITIIMGMAGLINNPGKVERIFSYDPYSYPFTHAFRLAKETAYQINIFPKKSIIYGCISVVVFFLAYFDFSKKNVK